MVTNKELEKRLNNSDQRLTETSNTVNRIERMFQELLDRQKVESKGYGSATSRNIKEAQRIVNQQKEDIVVVGPKLPVQQSDNRRITLLIVGFVAVVVFSFGAGSWFGGGQSTPTVDPAEPKADPIEIVAKAHEEAAANFFALADKLPSMDQAEVVKTIPTCMRDPINRATKSTVLHLQEVNKDGFDKKATAETLRHLGKTLQESAEKLRK